MADRNDSPDVVARTGVATAKGVLDGTVDLRAYPHHYLTLVSASGFSNRLNVAVSAAEVLYHLGWDLVNVFTTGSSGTTVCAVLRRR